MIVFACEFVLVALLPVCIDKVGLSGTHKTTHWGLRKPKRRMEVAEKGRDAEFRNARWAILKGMFPKAGEIGGPMRCWVGWKEGWILGNRTLPPGTEYRAQIWPKKTLAILDTGISAMTSVDWGPKGSSQTFQMHKDLLVMFAWLYLLQPPKQMSALQLPTWSDSGGWLRCCAYREDFQSWVSYINRDIEFSGPWAFKIKNHHFKRWRKVKVIATIKHGQSS